MSFKHFLCFDKRYFCWYLHVWRHPSSLPRDAISGDDWSRGGDGDVEVGVIHMICLGGMAPTTCHFSNDISSAQSFHDMHKLLCSPSSHSTGDDYQTLLWAISLTCKRQDKTVLSTSTFKGPLRSQNSVRRAEAHCISIPSVINAWKNPDLLSSCNGWNLLFPINSLYIVKSLVIIIDVATSVSLPASPVVRSFGYI